MQDLRNPEEANVRGNMEESLRLLRTAWAALLLLPKLVCLWCFPAAFPRVSTSAEATSQRNVASTGPFLTVFVLGLCPDAVPVEHGGTLAVEDTPAANGHVLSKGSDLPAVAGVVVLDFLVALFSVHHIFLLGAMRGVLSTGVCFFCENSLSDSLSSSI